VRAPIDRRRYAVLTDEELIERLRHGMSVLHPRADLIEELHRQVSRPKNTNVFGRIRDRRGDRRTGAGLAVALGCLVAILVAGAALTLSGPRAANPTTQTTQPPTRSAAGQALSSLEHAFPFLLRPQTNADRATSADNFEIGEIVSRGPTVAVVTQQVPIPRLTRLVKSHGITVRVFVARVVVARVDPASASTTGPVRRYEASLPNYVLAGQLSGDPGPEPLYARGHLPGEVVLTANPAPGHRIFSLVPADVTEVRWTWPRLANPAAGNDTPVTTITAHVHDNLAISAAHAVTAAHENTPPSVADWYDTAGHIIRRVTWREPTTR
jgi:hypothetical protein